MFFDISVETWTVVGGNYWFLWHWKKDLMQEWCDIYLKTEILKHPEKVYVHVMDWETWFQRWNTLCWSSSRGSAMKAVVLILSSHPVCWWSAGVASHIMSLSPPFAVSISLLQKPEEQKSYLTNKFFFHSTVTASKTWALPRTIEKNLTESDCLSLSQDFTEFAILSDFQCFSKFTLLHEVELRQRQA